MWLLEREKSINSLLEYAREARDGSGRVVLVSGEAGVGKSTLIEQFRDELRDARWSWGLCDALVTPRPLGPLFDIADALGGDLLVQSRADVRRDEVFRSLLREVNEPDRLNVVVIEDIHGADDATTDLLRFLSRRVRDVRALLIVTYRDEDGSAWRARRLGVP